MLALTLLMLAAGQVPSVASRDFPKALQERAVLATVKIVTPADGGSGTGLLVKRSGAFAYFLTASHIVGNSRQVEIHTFTARSYPRADKVYKSATVLARSAGPDLAVVRLATQDKLPDPIKVCLAKEAPRGKNFPVLSVGCGGGAAPTAVVDVVKEKRLIRRPGETDSVWCWETEKKQSLGRSGGPLLDVQGRLIGVASGRDSKHGYYGCLDEIHRFFRGNALKWLAEEDSD